MADIFIGDDFYMSTSSACLIDLTPPTFSGINFLDVESRGQIRAGWPVASDATAPIRYEIYIQVASATGLFNLSNIVAISPNTQYDIFTLPDGSFLQNGATYFVGVRAVDAVGNRNTNTVSLSVISTGVLTSVDEYESKAAWSINDNNQFTLSAWADKNGVLAISPSAILGTASYQVYDKAGIAVAGMSGAGVSANAQGLYVFPAVAQSLNLLNSHYQIRVSINVDGENRVNFIDILSFERKYSVNGVADFNSQGQVIGSFWVSRNEKVVTTDLGLGSFLVYSADGIQIPISESGITADANGFFVITPTMPPFPLDPSKGFIIQASIDIDGEIQSSNIVLGNEPEVYECKAVFSINALNQLESSFWATKNNDLVTGATLGTASYQVFDKLGIAVSGLTQSGITPDGNGYFHSTPISAALLSDLTHYTVKVTIVVAGTARVSTKGFTLLGT